MVLNYSLPIQNKQEPYQLFAFKGKQARNFSIDYAYTFQNIHLFGECATDKKLNKAWLSGFLMSLDKQVDLSIVYRSISRSYVSINGNAFTENTAVNNETGLYAGMSARLSREWRIDAYADIFCFPWLRYRADAPSTGSDLLFNVVDT
jgi:hypothetical protein